MNETKQIKFPIAAVFSTMNVLVMLIQCFFSYRLLRYTQMGVPMRAVLGGMVLPVLGLAAAVFLTVVLYMRKRGVLLWAPLGLDFAGRLCSLYNFASNFQFYPSVYALFYVAMQIIPVVNCLLFLLFAVCQDQKQESGAAKTFRKLWFIPGILSVFSGFGIVVGSGGPGLLINAVSGILIGIPMAFLLGWWLTHPYKKEKNVYQTPITEVDGQSGDPRVSAFDTAGKVFCAGCGQELSPDENFCTVCGKPRTMPVQDTQPVFQQQGNPQMGYVQDAPSGGMTALGFFFPIVGLILYLVWKDQTPLKAKSAGKGALIGVIVWTVLSVILAIASYVIPLLVFYSYF